MLGKIVLLGVVVSIFYTELTGLSAGLVIPGYLVLNLHSPEKIGYTLLLSAASALLVKAMSQRMILYGRRRLVMLLLLCFALDRLVGMTGIGFFRTDAIGIIVPGLIAREFDRQGFRDTLLSLFAVTCILSLILLVTGYAVI